MSAENNIMQFPKKSPYDCDTAEVFTSCKLPKDMSDWWKEQRKIAFNRFWEQGVPTQKLERFKYTNIAKAVAQWDGVLGDHEVQVENGGVYASPLSESFDVPWVKNMISADPPGFDKYGDMSLWDLNTAYLKHGTIVDIPADTIVDTPIVLTVQGVDDTYTSLRKIVRIGRNAEAVLIENHTGEGEYWKNHVTQIILEENAKLHHIRLVNESDAGVYTQNTHIQVTRDAKYNGFSMNSGCAVLRHQIHVNLQGVNGEASCNGLNLLSGSMHADTTITVEHQAPHCRSNQFYRSLLNDKARGVFQGKVHVHEGAQKTDGYQLSNTLLLSENAQMDTKPELEIYADDVVCSHGATTGQLDEEPLFYLRSRGLSEKEARFLLVQAFVGEVLNRVDNADVRVRLEQDVEQWLLKEL